MVTAGVYMVARCNVFFRLAPHAMFVVAVVGADAEGLVIARLYAGERELPDTLPPLLKPGVDAREGDRLLAINGRAVRTLAELGAALNQQAGQQVLLRLQRGKAAPHQTIAIAETADKEAGWRYADWVAGNLKQELRQRVEADIRDVTYRTVLREEGNTAQGQKIAAKVAEKYVNDFRNQSKIIDEMLTKDRIKELDGEHDLFGDGRLLVVPTPGHTPGHQALLVKMAGSTIFLLGDAAFEIEKMRRRVLPSIVWNPDKIVASWDRIEEIEREHGAELICAHELDYQTKVRIAPGAWWE